MTVPEPYAHQRSELERSAGKAAWGLLWQMRTGKSKVVIDTAARGGFATVLLFAPNGVHENWAARELPTHARQLLDVFVWDTARKNKDEEAYKRYFLRALRSRRQAWFCFASATMTRDDVRRCVARALKRSGDVLAVFDEAHDYRTPGSKRSRFARAVARKADAVRVLTGTPAGNTPLALWGIFELLRPGCLGYKRYGDFEARYAKIDWDRHRQGNKIYKRVTGYQRLDELRERVACWSSSLAREDCDDLPGLVFREKRFCLSEHQSDMLDDLLAQDLTRLEVAGNDVSLTNLLGLSIKYRQVVSGFIRDEFGKDWSFEENPRLNALRRELIPNCVVWAMFRYDLTAIVELCAKLRVPCVEYHGGVSAADKRKALTRFEQGGAVFVGQPQAAGQGLNLAKASRIVWYSHTYDAIVRNQANERATLIGGKNVEVVDLRANRVDGAILRNLKTKRETAERVDARRGLRELAQRDIINT